MGRYSKAVFQRAQAGSRPVHQFNRGLRSTAAFAAVQGQSSSSARFKLVAVAPGSWAADATGYPDAAALGNPTLYRADVAHNLGNTHAVVVALQDGTGLDVSPRIQFATNDDPSNPGTRHNNSVRIWISMDAAPAADLYVVVLG